MTMDIDENNATDRLYVFAGPRKTGTSWLSDLTGTTHGDKEVFLPSAWPFSEHIYKKFVKSSNLIIWPYLLHEPASLKTLLRLLKKDGREYQIIVTQRDPKKLQESLKKFSRKYGGSGDNVEKELAVVEQSIAELVALNENLVQVDLFSNNESHDAYISGILGIDKDKYKSAKSTRVYETNEVATVPIAGLTNLFFKLKGFMPSWLRHITRQKWIRRTLLKKAINEGGKR